MSPADFRKELIKIMPGYTWTVHKTIMPTFAPGKHHEATGIISSGFNRISTLKVIRRDRDGKVEYEVTSAGFGAKAPWLSTYTRPTLARALRDLQNHYEHMACLYSGHAARLRNARKPKDAQVADQMPVRA